MNKITNGNYINRIREIDVVLFQLYGTLYETELVCGRDSSEYQSIIENIKLVKSVESKLYNEFLKDETQYRKAVLEYFNKMDNLSFGEALDNGMNSCIDFRIFYFLYGKGFCRYDYLLDTRKLANRMIDNQSQFIRQAYYCEDAFWFHYFLEKEIEKCPNEFVSGELLQDFTYAYFMHPYLEERKLICTDSEKRYPLPYQDVISGIAYPSAIAFLQEYSSDIFQSILEAISYFSMILEREDLDIEDREYLLSYNRATLYSGMLLLPDDVYGACVVKLFSEVCNQYSSKDHFNDIIELVESMQHEREQAKELVANSKIKTIR